ncbi:MAG TPA: hypothetical protein VMT15_00040 [Bryobacteraceae bacterium]|nr:hypothetical protein [Bryobacteraceae bacterium]
MRTTLTLDDDVAILLERVRKQNNATLKDVVNTALRGGLAAMSKPAQARTAFRTRTFRTGKCLVPSIESIADALSIAEGESYR